jgi:hypothetical protein
MDALLALPLRLWLLTLLCAASFALLWWLTLGQRRIRRRHALRQRLSELGDGPVPIPTAAIPALPSVADPFQGRWLLMGDAAANLQGLLEAGDAMLLTDAGPDALWQIWTRPGLTLVALNPSVVDDAQSTAMRSLWLRGLMVLEEHCPALPLNGIVVCVDAETLAQSTSTALGLLAAEAAELLQLQLPVQVVVTGLERWPGHADVCAGLPPAALEQVLGHRLPPRDATGGSAGERLDALFAPLSQRLQALGMALLRAHAEPASRLGVHRWVAQSIALQPGLHRLANRLFGQAPGTQWRGLYLTAAASQTGRAAFATDLFRRFLQEDQPLARSGRTDP